MKDFKAEIVRASAMKKVADSALEEAYWTAYERGLRRAYHGRAFGTPEEHRKWLSLAHDEDAMRRKKGEGYRAGLAALMPPSSYMAMLGGATRTPARQAAARAAGESRAEIRWTELPDGRWQGEREGIVMIGRSKPSLRLRLREAIRTGAIIV